MRGLLSKSTLLLLGSAIFLSPAFRLAGSACVPAAASSSHLNSMAFSDIETVQPHTFYLV
jgi:hypothetical protein